MRGRSILAVIGGIVVGAIVAYFSLIQVEKLYPIDPEVFETIRGDKDAFQAYLRNLPTSYHLAGLGIGILRLVIGLFVGRWIDKSNAMIPLTIAAFSLLLGLLDVFAFPHPIWYGFVYIPLLIGIAFLFIFTQKKA